MVKFVSLTFELEEFSASLDFGKEIEEEEMFRITQKRAEEIGKLLENLKIKASFFVTENVALNLFEIVKRLEKRGHEIGLHGIAINNLKELAREKEAVKNASRSEIIGHRAHKFRKPSLKILRKIGIRYDSSIHPTYVPGRYNNLFAPRKSYANEILKISLSVAPLLRLPFSFVWFRNLGLKYVKFCTSLASKGQDLINIYLHTWEFTDISNFDLPFYLTRNTGKKANMDDQRIWEMVFGKKF
jgi:peptidoglycan/xylan/chitin deacetylase (PgdA/CDA1 family)